MPTLVDDSPHIDVTAERSAELSAVSLRPGSDPTGGDPVNGTLP
jgi:hypothetical protein